MTADFGKTRTRASEHHGASGFDGPTLPSQRKLAQPAEFGSRAKRPATTQHFVLACCPVGSLVFGLDAKLVANIDDHVAPTASEASEGGDESSPLIDLAEELGLDLSGPITRRRCLTLQVGERSERLLVGQEVAVRELVGRLLPLPSFVAGLGPQAAISGLITLQQRYLFVLDLPRLVENALTRRASKFGSRADAPASTVRS